MSWTAFPTVNNTGVRRLHTLGAMWGLGSTGSSVGDGMVSEGYNSVIISNLVAAGASDAQLQNLWDNYGAGTPEFGQAATQLQASLAPPGSIFDLTPATTSASNATIFNPSAVSAANAVKAVASATPPGLIYSAVTGQSAGGGLLPAGGSAITNTPPSFAIANPSPLPPGSPSLCSSPNLSFAQWAGCNSGLLTGVLFLVAAIVILPPLIKKL
jgi:hypothetical protein